VTPAKAAAGAVLAATLLACAGSQGGSSVAKTALAGRELTHEARYEEAQETLLRAVALAEASPGPSLDRAMAFYSLADLYDTYPPLAEPREAIDLFGRAIAEYEAIVGPDNAMVGLVVARQAAAYRDRNDLLAADELDRRAADIFAKTLPETHPIRMFHAAGQAIPVHPDEVANVRWEESPEPAQQSAAAPEEGPPAELPPVQVDASGTYLQPNMTRSDGSRGYMHVTPDDMPWIIAVGRPKRPPRDGSTGEAREAAIEAMKMWEDAIQPHLPWFRLAFVEVDPNAPVQVEWKRRITGPWAGFGGMGWGNFNGRIRVGGRMEVSTTPDNFTVLEVDEVRLLIAHEFGHVLGLGHCLECDSAMNYSWATRERIVVTDLDVATFLALVAQENAYR